MKDYMLCETNRGAAQSLAVQSQFDQVQYPNTAEPEPNRSFLKKDKYVRKQHFNEVL